MTVGTPDLSKTFGRRRLTSLLFAGVTGGMTAVALVPLAAVLGMLLWRGGRRLSVELFTALPPAAGEAGGGIGNALIGTAVVVAVAAALSVPAGILAAVYLAEFGAGTRLAAAARFAARVLAGLPSVLAGVFAYALVVKLTGTFSPLAGGVALALLMLPTVVLTAEEALRQVNPRVRDAALGLGATPAQAAWQVVLPAAAPGVLTGVLLAVARAAGETAPLLFTVLFSDYWPRPALEPVASLSVLIYEFSGSPFAGQVDVAWAAALVLVSGVLALNLSVRGLVARGSAS